MATILKPSYGAATTITFTVSGLASDATNLVAGRQSAVINNTTDLAVDALVGGSILTGTNTANTIIEVWVGGSWDNGTTYLAGGGGGDAALSPANVGVKRAMKLGIVIDVIETTARTYTFMFSVAQCFGGTMPDHWHLYVVHNTGANLSTTTVKYTPIQYTNV